MTAGTIEIVGSGFVGRSLARGLERRCFDTVLRPVREGFVEQMSLGTAARPLGIVFAAGRASPGMAVDDIGPALERFEELLLPVRDRVARLGVERVLLVSSAGPVYGGSAHEPTESTPPSPSTPYGRLKLAEEELARSLMPRTCAVTALRCTNLYGPEQSAQREQGLIPIVIRRALTGRPVTVFGTGAQRRDYFFVEDLADVVEAVLGAAPVDVLNVSVGHRLTVMDIISAVETALGVVVDVEHTPADESLTSDQPTIDHERLRDLLGSRWEPTSLADGIEATVTAMR